MTDQIFIINNRFSVNSSLNLVKDIENELEIRLEPRLISLLRMLSENAGKLITRDVIIQEIWNNYGGAEDGLNQAISMLRKTLNDSEKKIIETVPKKGYVLKATIRIVEPVVQNKKLKIADFKRYAIAVGIIVVFVCGYVYYEAGTQQKILTRKSAMKNSIETDFSEIDVAVEKSYLNTITTTDTKGTRYRLYANRDKRPDFYVNDQLVPISNRDQYSELIDKMLHQLWVRQKQRNDSLEAK